MTTVTTTAVATSGLGAFALIVTVTLIALLIGKDIVDGRSGLGARRIGRALAIGILPLLTVFAVDILVRALEVLG
jgi:hypothetical protein